MFIYIISRRRHAGSGGRTANIRLFVMTGGAMTVWIASLRSR
jgi:hypothetical protein